MNTGTPWALGRMVPQATSFLPHTSVHLDPDTQQGVYVGPGGTPIEAGKHGTNRQTAGCLATGGSDGNAPAPADDTASTDYDKD
ncbi:putative ATP-grasp-modified RiPP [Microtetraspora niveoalba]|uniref:putative ATP-grasp-modified RiPP n=1 Tax=Microtetraspora niveoalba TaxID=46175 RepID=UPI00082C986C|nr:putative ATP-grasp-modified RiPP [Microtetraspora niveoalba]